MMCRAASLEFSRLLELAARGDCSVRSHSGMIRPGDIFVALPPAVARGATGATSVGGEAYVDAALQAGAAYIVCDAAQAETVARRIADAGAEERTVVVPCGDTRRALGELAAAVCSTASKQPRLIAVTGTNGKTTTAYMLETILQAAGHRVGLVGTIEYRWPGHAEPAPLTTPDCLTLHGMFAAMAGAGVDTAVMEASSHALDQNRVAGLNFSGALFTNLTQDHLDYHTDMEGYFAAKARLFTGPEQGGVPFGEKAAAVNVDDCYGQRLLAMCPKAVSYGVAGLSGRHLRGELLERSIHGMSVRMWYEGREWTLHSPLAGEFNAANLLGAQALALALGLLPADMGALETFAGPPGRLERIPNPKNLSVFVDYAHTPDALVKAITALRGSGFARIITVFGCGGNRDKSKRALMGKAVAENADVAVLTSDNPRHEDPLEIIAEILPGLRGGARVIVEADRRRAIALALEEPGSGDALLITGKGHERYQIIGDMRLPFNDSQVVKELLGCA